MTLTTQPCPKCSAAVDVSMGFGMTSCSECGEIIMIGQEPPAPQPLDPFEAPPEPAGPTSGLFDPVSFQEPSRVQTVAFDPGPIETEPVEFTSTEQQPSEPLTMPFDFRQVESFGNQTTVAPAVGGLVYNLVIEGINTPEDRKTILECLSDRRFEVDAQALVSGIKGGHLTLKQWNPVKAAVLVSRLKHLPFEISWTAFQMLKSFIVLFFIFTSVQVFAEVWDQHEVNLAGFGAKLKAAQDEIKALIESKNLVRDPKEREKLLQDIVKKHDAMLKIYRDIKQEEAHIRFQHPEKGDKEKRRYKRVKEKTLEELEDELGLDGQLSRIKRKVEDQYPSK